MTSRGSVKTRADAAVLVRNAFDAVVAEQRQLADVLIELPIVPAVVRVGLLAVSELVTANGVARRGRDVEIAGDGSRGRRPSARRAAARRRRTACRAGRHRGSRRSCAPATRHRHAVAFRLQLGGLRRACRALRCRERHRPAGYDARGRHRDHHATLGPRARRQPATPRSASGALRAKRGPRPPRPAAAPRGARRSTARVRSIGSAARAAPDADDDQSDGRGLSELPPAHGHGVQIVAAMYRSVEAASL